MTGLNSSADTPYDDVEWGKEAFTLPFKRSFRHQTVYCLGNRSQITYSCCSSNMLFMHFDFKLFLTLFVQIFAL